MLSEVPPLFSWLLLQWTSLWPIHFEKKCLFPHSHACGPCILLEFLLYLSTCFHLYILFWISFSHLVPTKMLNLFFFKKKHYANALVLLFLWGYKHCWIWWVNILTHMILSFKLLSFKLLSTIILVPFLFLIIFICKSLYHVVTFLCLSSICDFFLFKNNYL